MKNFRTLLLAVVLAACFAPNSIKAQEEATDAVVTEEKSSPITIGADFVSRYIFRGLDFGTSPAIQPGIEFGIGGFYIGAWGSYAFLATPTGIEADLYAGYSFNFGLSAGITDYYFPGERLTIQAVDSSSLVIAPERDGSYFNYSENHYFELNLTQEIGDFYLAANWFFSDNMSNDLYFEAGYSFSFLDIFVGAGNEAYTTDGEFDVVNVGISASKDIKFTEKFSLPLSASLILNPDAEQLHIVFAISF